jgi:hypothetical protein
MVQEAILWPMGTLVLWTLAVLTLIPFVRVRAVQAGRARPRDFKYGESTNVPGDVSIPNRDYMNLLELPVLFYGACLAIYASKQVDGLFVTLAWGFVGARVVHSLIHLTYNHVLHRLAAFGVGFVLLAVIWIRFLIALPI